jgi:hypothetical protein
MTRRQLFSSKTSTRLMLAREKVLRRRDLGLPAPAQGEFNLVFRNYWPKEEALNGAYLNPPIKKVD